MMCLRAVSKTKLIFSLLFIVTVVGCILVIRSQHGIFRQNNRGTYMKGHPAADGSCPLVLKGGRFVKHDIWVPYGCTLHNYTYGYTQKCVEAGKKRGARDHIVFMGDSRIRDIFDDFKVFFVKNTTNRKSQDYQRYETDLAILEFFWRSTIGQILSAMQSLSFLPRKQRPRLILAGCAAHDIVRGSAKQEALDKYKAHLKDLRPYLIELQHTTTLIWMIQPRLNVTAYRIRKLYHPKYCVLTNEQIDLYNVAAKETLQSSPVQLWSTARIVVERFYEDMKDGIHVGQRANYWNVQLLLNVFCNQRLTKYISATCCNPPDRRKFTSVF